MAREVKSDRPRRSRGARISSKHQVTIPIHAFAAAGLQEGDVLTIESAGPGRIVLTRQDDLLDQFSGALRGGPELRQAIDSLRD